jgi:hypothetical protein
MIKVTKRVAAWKRLLPLLLAFEFAVSPVIFGSRGFDLPRLGSAVPSIRSTSREQSPIYSVFLAHHQRGNSRALARNSFVAAPSSLGLAISAKKFPVANKRLFLKSICLARIYRPPAVFPA